MTPIMTPIVLRAMVRTVTNIGQISHQEQLELNRAVRNGYLSKGKGGSFPILKTVYAHPDFNFAVDREARVAEMKRCQMVDMARGVDHLFPVVEFQERA